MVKSEKVEQHRGVLAGRELLQLWAVYMRYIKLSFLGKAEINTIS